METSPIVPRRNSPSTRVLLIDDDERLGALLTEYLRNFSMVVRAATRPHEGLRLLKDDPPDIVILDLMLPEMDGLSVCRKIRDTSQAPILMLTARGDVADRIVGLEMGADDYLPKPFEPRELVARIQAVLRRGPEKNNDKIRLGSLEIDLGACAVRLKNRPLILTTAEFELLRLFVKNRGRALTRDRIMDEIRGIDWEAYDRSIDVLVSRLRQKLGDDPRQPTYIRTIRGRGYSFLGDDHE